MFGILFSLIGLGIALLFLPLRLFSGVLGLVLVPLKIVIKLLTRNLFIVALIIIIVLIYRAIDSSNSSLPELTPAAAPPPSAQKGQPRIVVEPVLKKEDGDSSFATDLYAAMTEAERATYSYHYYYAMGNVAPGQPYSWNGGNIEGSLRPGEMFTNNSGVRCRRFSEVLKVHTIQQTLSGTACEQGSGAWCKLKPNATAACNLGGYKPGLLESIGKMF